MADADRKEKVWYWCPAPNVQHRDPDYHPSWLPQSEESARVFYIEGKKGPAIARIAEARVSSRKGSLYLLNPGSGKEVETIKAHRVLKWPEGLLILEELAKKPTAAAWFDDSLKKILDTERQAREKAGKSMVALACQYVQNNLFSHACTGRDDHYRRKHSDHDASEIIEADDEELQGDQCAVEEVLEYMPPWQSFVEKGTYQDFYKIRWKHWEDAEWFADDTDGTTWEPEECVSVALDPLKIMAKKAWLEKWGQSTSTAVAPKGEPEEEPRNAPEDPRTPAANPSVRTAAATPSGRPFELDLLDSNIQVDFNVGLLKQTDSSRFCSGWPKRKEDFPPGRDVCKPPGYCWANCDCMDDGRPQALWETTKSWLESSPQDKQRHAQVKHTLGLFYMEAKQRHSIFQRGQSSGQHYFECPPTHGLLPHQYNELRHDEPNGGSTRALAGHVAKAIRHVLERVPFSALIPGSGGAVRVHARAFLDWEKNEQVDCEVLRIVATKEDRTSLPPWAHFDPDAGTLMVKEQGPKPAKGDFPLRVHAHLMMTEGSAGVAKVSVHAEDNKEWLKMTEDFAQQFLACQHLMETQVRNCLAQELGQLYVLKTRTVRPCSLATWLDVMGILLGMLRAAAGARLFQKFRPTAAAAPASASPPRGLQPFLPAAPPTAGHYGLAAGPAFVPQLPGGYGAAPHASPHASPHAALHGRPQWRARPY